MCEFALHVRFLCACIRMCMSAGMYVNFEWGWIHAIECQLVCGKKILINISTRSLSFTFCLSLSFQSVRLSVSGSPSACLPLSPSFFLSLSRLTVRKCMVCYIPSSARWDVERNPAGGPQVTDDLSARSQRRQHGVRLWGWNLFFSIAKKNYFWLYITVYHWLVHNGLLTYLLMPIAPSGA